MIIDKALEFSDKQSLASGAAVSTNVLDFDVANRNFNVDFGNGKLAIVVTVNEAVTGDLVVKVEDSADDTTYAAIYTGATLASPAAGTQLVIPMPAVGPRRYLRMNYTAGTTPLSAGKVSAQIVFGHDRWEAVPGATL